MWNTLPPLFRGLSQDDLDEAMGCFKVVEIPAGTALIEEGEVDPTLVLVEEGRLEVTTGRTVLASVSEGDLIGEIALFSGAPRTATVTAQVDARLLALDAEGYEALRNVNHPVALAIEERALEHLVERLGALTRRIAELSEGAEAARVVPAAGFFDRVASAFGTGGLLFPGRVDGLSVLRGSPLFAGVPDEVLAEVARSFEPIAAQRGEFLCTEGQTGDEMFVIASGKVEVIVAVGKDKLERLATLEAGDAFGMCALIQPSASRMASCVASERVTALVLGKIRYAELATRGDLAGSAMRVAMIRSMADQVAYANGQMAKLDLEEQEEYDREFAAERARAREQEREHAVQMAGAALEAHGAYIQMPTLVFHPY